MMITISLKMPHTMHEQVLRYAKKHGLNTSEFIRTAVSHYILMLRNRELSEMSNPAKVKIRVVSITVPYRKKIKKEKSIIKIKPSETLIKRDLPPPKIKTVRIEI